MLKKFVSSVLCLTLLCVLFGCGAAAQKEPADYVDGDYEQFGVEEDDSSEQVSSASESIVDDVQDSSSSEAELSDEEILFESDETVNQFLNAYNEVAEYKIEPEDVEKGNIRTKAILSLNDLYIEIVNASDDYLSVSITNSHEADTFFQVFRDFVLAHNQNIEIDTITTAWNDIQNGYYEIDYGNGVIGETYEVEGIQMAYINSSNRNRVDLLFALNE